MRLAVYARGLTALLEQAGREFCVPLEWVSFSQPGSLVVACQGGGFAAALLDGELPRCLEAGQRLRAVRRECPILLLAGEGRTAVEGYAIHPDALVRKPAGYRALTRALERCLPNWLGEARAVPLVANRVKAQVACADIHTIQADGRGLILRGRYGQLQLRMSMSQMEGLLAGAPFLKCHRGYLVNLFQIRAIERDSLTLADGERVPLSEDRRRQVRARWERFCLDNPVFSRWMESDRGDS